MPPRNAAECRERAEQCERLAATTSSSHVREIMLYVASRWRVLADADQGSKDEGDGEVL